MHKISYHSRFSASRFTANPEQSMSSYEPFSERAARRPNPIEGCITGVEVLYLVLSRAPFGIIEAL